MENKINPDMLVIARESRMMTQIQLANRVEIPQGHLSKIESGIMPITEEILRKVVHELRYPEHFFSMTDVTFGFGPSMFFHRKRQSLPQKLLRYIHAQINIRCIQIKNLLRQGKIESSIPRLDIDEFGGDVERIAATLRAHWILPDGPIRSVTETIENAGGIVVALNFETTLLDAISIWPPEMPPLFFVNKNVPADRLRHTLCHELGHMIMHFLATTDDLKKIEDEANKFAGAFLLPAKEIGPSLNKLSLPKLASLKRYWKVSMGAIIERAFQLKKISERTRQTLWTQMSKAGYKMREPVLFDGSLESPFLLKRIIDIHRGRLEYSIKQLSNLLALDEIDFRAIFLNEPTLRVI